MKARLAYRCTRRRSLSASTRFPANRPGLIHSRTLRLEILEDRRLLDGLGWAAQVGRLGPPGAAATVVNGSSHLAVGHFNRDGKLDIVVANALDDNVSVLLGRGNGTLAPQVTYSSGLLSSPHCAALGDLDGDRDLDIVPAFPAE